MNVAELIITDPDIISGQPVFAGTRVPVETLFDHLEAGIPLDEFLDDFPTVTRVQAIALLDMAAKLLPADKAEEISDFADFVSKRYEEQQLAQGIQQLAAESQAFTFLHEEEDLYMEADSH